MPKKTKNNKNIYLNILILISTVIIMFLIIEISLRIFTNQITQDMIDKRSPKIFQNGTYINIELIPNSNDKMIGVFNEYHTNIAINSMGWRDKEYTIEKPNNTIRILVIGDSFVFGEGVESEEIFGNVLEHKLNSNNTKKINYEVITMGVGGYSTDNQYLHYINRGLKYNPDIVILAVLPSNDFAELNRSIWLNLDSEGLPTKTIRPEFYVSKDNRRKNGGELGKYTETKFHLILNRYSYTYIFFKNYISRLFIQPSYIGGELCEEYNPELKDGFNKNIKIINKMNEITKTNNQKFFVFIIPNRYQYDTERYNNKEMYSCIRNYNEPELKIKDALKNTDIIIIDPLEDFVKKYDSKDKYNYPIDAHWNAQGHELASNSLYEYISQNINIIK